MLKFRHYILFTFLCVIYTQLSATSLKLLWKNTDVAENRQWGEADYRTWQAVGMNGCIYLQNASRNVVEVWNEDGKIKEIPSGKGTNICKDDKGNLIVRYTSYTKPFLTNNQIIIINPQTGNSKIISVGEMSGDKAYLFGKATGDYMNGDGALYCMANGDTEINKVCVFGEDSFIDYPPPYKFSQLIYPQIDIARQRNKAAVNTNAMVIPVPGTDNPELAVSNPYHDLTSKENGYENSIYNISIIDNIKLQRNGFYRTPNHNGCAGFDILDTDSIKMILYPSGVNNCDGFSVARIQELTEKPDNDILNKNILIVEKEEDKDNQGNVKYKAINNELYVNNLNFEITKEGEIYIYQYVPCAYIAMYKLDLSNNGDICNLISDKCKVVGKKGYIEFNKNIQHTIYDLSGKCIKSGNQIIEHVSPGIYIVKTKNNTFKVSVTK